ncbi:hypothetical protein [Falsirhodobacter sp. 20TX0035]|uniref:hypothetical protein n=1 Tax=Falsirhodobacter sp. 20TX0035 TaxID=3022019 RepID=UPI00232B0BF8|nr:hypothetical protein [Falsirhodobacter sp. 20TX0035]MDB6454700.1 hypothetical protein [Falsirhodobacter sp. 20TX0035]
MDYARAAATAKRLLTGAQQGVVVLSREVPGQVDPAKPWVPVQLTVQTEGLTATVKGVSAAFVDGTAVLASDLEVLCVPPAMGVDVTDTIIIDGKRAAIVRVTPIPAAGQAAVLRLIVRG